MSKYIIRGFVALSLAFNLAALAGGAAFIHYKGGLPYLSRKIFGTEKRGGYHDTKQSVYDQLSIKPGDIVMVGDSILDFGEWSEFLGPRAKNRAISGDTTNAVLKRLPAILDGKPRHVVIECGMNDLLNNRPVREIVRDYSEILATVTTRLPDADVWIFPVLPVNSYRYRQWIVPEHPGIRCPDQKEVKELNDRLRSLAASDRRIHFVELPGLCDGSGIRDAYTYDGLHLNGAGLKCMADRLRPLLAMR